MTTHTERRFTETTGYGYICQSNRFKVAAQGDTREEAEQELDLLEQLIDSLIEKRKRYEQNRP